MEFLRLFLRRHFAGEPVEASPNVSCFLRLIVFKRFTVWDCFLRCDLNLFWGRFSWYYLVLSNFNLNFVSRWVWWAPKRGMTAPSLKLNASLAWTVRFYVFCLLSWILFNVYLSFWQKFRLYNSNIVIRGDWLWKAANINDKNNSAAVYVGSTVKVHNPLFSVGKLLRNKLMQRFYWSIQSKW